MIRTFITGGLLLLSLAAGAAAADEAAIRKAVEAKIPNA